LFWSQGRYLQTSSSKVASQASQVTKRPLARVGVGKSHAHAWWLGNSMQAIRKLLLLCWKLLFSNYRSNDHSLLDVYRKWRGCCYEGRTLIPVVMRRPDVVLECTLTRSPSRSKSPAHQVRVSKASTVSVTHQSSVPYAMVSSSRRSLDCVS